MTEDTVMRVPDVDPHDEEHLERVIEELAEDVDVYYAGAGPEGPWPYRSLTVWRMMNAIRVFDVDGQLVAQYQVQNFDSDRIHEQLESKLERLNERCQEAL